MANIKPYTDQIKNAVYGEEVRDAIVGAIEKVNDDNESYQQLKKDVVDAKEAVDAQVEIFSGMVTEAQNTKDALDGAVNIANTTKKNLEDSTGVANTAKNNLNAVIEDADAAKGAVQTATQNANTAKGNLENTISASGNSKTALEGSISTANQTKSGLDASVDEADETKTALENANAVAEQNKTSLDSKNALAAENLEALQDENFKSDELLTGVEDIKAYLGYTDQDIVGICADFKNRTFKRLAGAYGKTAGAEFDSFAMFGGRKRCNVANDGTINAYYGDDGYTEDGSNGQVMVYQPAFYYRVVPLEVEKNTVSGIGYHLRKANYYVSTRPKTGFKLHPAFYDVNGNPVDYILMSAYEGSMYDASASAYVNDSVDTSIAYAAGDLLCSVAGKKPISGLRSGMGTKANFEAMANNRGSGWHLENIKATSANQLLMIIELGTMNTQTAIGQGVVSITDNSAYNCASLTGSTASIGNGTGQAAETINEIGGAETAYTTSGKTSITYRGVENPWGNLWKHIQGINIWGDGSMGGGQPYVADGFEYNESKNSDPYHPVGFTLSNANGYIKAMGYGSEEFDWLLMPSEIGGDSALPVGDYCYVTANLNGYRIARLGGRWHNGGHAGGFCWSCDDGVGYRYRYFGGRLLYVPTATV